MIKVLSVFGTRPEAVKMAPVVLALQKHPAQICARVCVTGQHREMLDQVLALFEITPHVDLNLMQPNQTLSGLTARILTQMDQVLASEAPDIVLVQGDTTTVMATSLAAFYRQIPVGHVEAGLRSGDIYSPFPEEINRRMAGVISHFHFAPTETSRQALLRENTPDSSIYVTGNTVIDALHATVNKPMPPVARQLLMAAGVHSGSERVPKLILVTAHRRENFGAPMESICRALKTLVERNPDVTVLYPVHLNPNVQEPVRRILGDTERIVLAEPVTYDVMAHLMNAAHLVLTDSGGLQEEAPTLGKPVLVMRTETERPEAVESGTAKLVGTDESVIVAEAETLLHDQAAYERMARAVSPYGDGHAAERIVDILLEKLKKPTKNDEDSLEIKFHYEMLKIFTEVQKQNYYPTYFLQMVHEQGGVKAAKQLLAKQEIQPGLMKLYELKLLHTSMESYVIQDQFRPLFDNAEIEEARRRLKELNYFDK